MSKIYPIRQQKYELRAYLYLPDSEHTENFVIAGASVRYLLIVQYLFCQVILPRSILLLYLNP